MAEVGTAYVNIVPSLKGAKQTIGSEIGEKLGAAGKKAGDQMGKQALGAVKKHAKAIGAALSVAAVTKFAKSCTGSFQNLASQTKSLQRVMGGTASEVSGVAGAMRLAGMDTSKANTSLVKFSKYVNSAATGTESAQETFKQLGISLKGSDGNLKSTSTLLEEAADKFAGMEDGAQKTALATTLFGKSGTAMLPFLNKGSEGIEELKKKAEELGITLDDQSMTKFSEYKSAVREWQTALEGAQVSIGESLTPFITMATSALTTTLVPAIQGAADTLSSFLDSLSAGIDAEGLNAALGSVSQAFGSVFGGGEGDAAAGFGSALANVINGLIPVISGAAPIVQALGTAFKFVSDNMQAILPIVGGVVAGIVALKVITTVTGAFGGAAAPIAAAGNAAGGAATKMLSLGAAVLMIGGGIFLAATGMSMMANAAVTLSSGGAGAAVAMAAMVGSIAALAVGAAVLGPALTASAVGMLAFGAAVALVGVGVLAASAGLVLVASALPTIAAFGPTGAAGLLLVGTASLAATPGIAALAVALAAAAVPAAAFALAGAGAAAALLTMGTGAMMGATGITAMMSVLPGLPGVAQQAASGMQALTDKMNACSAPMSAAAGAISSAVGTIGGAVASLVAASAGMSSLASASKACQGSMKGIGSAAKAAASAVKSMAAAPKAAQSAFASLANAGKRNMSTLKGTVASSMAAIKKSVGTKLKMSKIDVGKLPHFSFSGSFDAKSKKVPKLNVSWYAKGGVFDGPSVIGIGEAGREAALPLNDRTYAEIAKGISTQGGTSNSVVINLNYSKDADANQMVRDIAAGLRRLQMTGA